MSIKKFILIVAVSIIPILGFCGYAFFTWQMPYPDFFSIVIIGLFLLFAIFPLLSVTKIKNLEKNVLKVYLTVGTAAWLILTVYAGIATRDLYTTVLGGSTMLFIILGMPLFWAKIINKDDFKFLRQDDMFSQE